MNHPPSHDCPDCRHQKPRPSPQVYWEASFERFCQTQAPRRANKPAKPVKPKLYTLEETWLLLSLICGIHHFFAFSPKTQTQYLARLHNCILSPRQRRLSNIIYETAQQCATRYSMMLIWKALYATLPKTTLFPVFCVPAFAKPLLGRVVCYYTPPATDAASPPLPPSTSFSAAHSPFLLMFDFELYDPPSILTTHTKTKVQTPNTKIITFFAEAITFSESVFESTGLYIYTMAGSERVFRIPFSGQKA